MKKLVHTFAPLYNENTEILILGSFPSVKSRENDFYYMNPQNRFYKVLSILLEEDIYNCSIEKKKEILLRNRIGIYDVVQSCTISGSSDASINNVIVNDVDSIVINTKIKKICLNGTLAYNLFIKYFSQYKSIAIKLPSTSPANAKYNLDDLIREWKRIL